VRLARSLFIGAGIALGAFVLAALTLAALGLYQSGHGQRAWTDTRVIDGSGVHLSLADTISLVVAACFAVVGFAFMYRKS
jgi:hypothetical protein